MPDAFASNHPDVSLTIQSRQASGHGLKCIISKFNMGIKNIINIAALPIRDCIVKNKKNNEHKTVEDGEGWCEWTFHILIFTFNEAAHIFIYVPDT